jgi:SPP1 family predicted phage head-tail adaptor
MRNGNLSIGELRQRITFQIPKTSINDNGFEETIFEDYKTVWAKVSNLSGREYFEAASFNQENTVIFKIRNIYINEEMQIIFKDKKYNIFFIDNTDYKNKYIEIKALEVNKNA